MSKILIIEDEVAIADLEKDYLELSGFDVQIEYAGDKGLTRALKEDFDLIVLDLMLPGIDGFEVCRRIREEKNVPILMVSAKKDDIDKIRGLGLGADDYMTKPFSPSELVARVKAHMARYERLTSSHQKTNDIIEIRGLKIDKTARRVWINGEEKAFTTKEFDLLTFLAVPKSALAPLFIVWLGTGINTIIIAGISVAVFGSIISFYTAFHQVDPEKEILIRTLGGNRRDIFFKVVLPGSVPTLLSTTKVNIGLSLVGVIIGEFLAARRGLGYLIIYGSQVFQLDMVISSILLLCVIAMLLYLLTQSLEHCSKKHRN